MSSILNEAYYGKQKEMLRVEELLESIRLKVLKNPTLYNPNNSKENIEIMDIYKKLFNVEEFEISWVNSQTSANGFTVPLSLIVFNSYEDYDVVQTSKGIRFKSPKGKSIFVALYTGLITVSEMTAPELNTIILHEVGHNFFNSRYNLLLSSGSIILNMIEVILKILETGDVGFLGQAIMNILLISSNARVAMGKIRRLIASNKALSIIDDTGSSLLGLLQDYINLFYRSGLHIMMAIVPISPPQFILAGISTIPALVNTVVFRGYENEKFSDNFATSYGYGVEMATISKKFDRPSSTSLVPKIIDSLGPLSILYKINTFLLMSITSLTDCHPHSHTRILDQAKMLKSELARDKDIPPKMKASMRSQIEDIEKCYELTTSSERLNKDYRFLEAFVYGSLLPSLGIPKEDIKEKFVKTNKGLDGDWDEFKPQSQRSGRFR